MDYEQKYIILRILRKTYKGHSHYDTLKTDFKI